MIQYSPPVKLDFLETKNGKICVVRDDVLDGGTKQRAAVPYLEFYRRMGISEFVYASPFSGYAQIALSCSSKLVGVKSTIFAQCDPKTSDKSKFSEIAEQNSEVYVCNSLLSAEKMANDYCDSFCKMKIPLGFDDSIYRFFLKRELRRHWLEICSSLGYIPQSIWLPIGSGTLVKTFRKFLPKTVKINSVDVGVLDSDDYRIDSMFKLSNINYIRSPEAFVDKAQRLPPIPSNLYYDAKLWRFIYERAELGDLWWNVAA